MGIKKNIKSIPTYRVHIKSLYIHLNNIDETNKAGYDIGNRDAHMSSELRKIMTLHPSAHIAVPVGMVHTVSDGKERTLYEKIKDLKPTRVIVDYREDVEREINDRQR